MMNETETTALKQSGTDTSLEQKIACPTVKTSMSTLDINALVRSLQPNDTYPWRINPEATNALQEFWHDANSHHQSAFLDRLITFYSFDPNRKGHLGRIVLSRPGFTEIAFQLVTRLTFRLFRKKSCVSVLRDTYVDCLKSALYGHNNVRRNYFDLFPIELFLQKILYSFNVMPSESILILFTYLCRDDYFNETLNHYRFYSTIRSILLSVRFSELTQKDKDRGHISVYTIIPLLQSLSNTPHGCNLISRHCSSILPILCTVMAKSPGIKYDSCLRDCLMLLVTLYLHKNTRSIFFTTEMLERLRLLHKDDNRPVGSLYFFEVNAQIGICFLLIANGILDFREPDICDYFNYLVAAANWFSLPLFRSHQAFELLSIMSSAGYWPKWPKKWLDITHSAVTTLLLPKVPLDTIVDILFLRYSLSLMFDSYKGWEADPNEDLCFTVSRRLGSITHGCHYHYYNPWLTRELLAHPILDRRRICSFNECGEYYADYNEIMTKLSGLVMLLILYCFPPFNDYPKLYNRERFIFELQEINSLAAQLNLKPNLGDKFDVTQLMRLLHSLYTRTPSLLKKDGCWLESVIISFLRKTSDLIFRMGDAPTTGNVIKDLSCELLKEQEKRLRRDKPPLQILFTAWLNPPSFPLGSEETLTQFFDNWLNNPNVFSGSPVNEEPSQSLCAAN